MIFTNQQLKQIYNEYVKIEEYETEGSTNFKYFLKKSTLVLDFEDFYAELRNKKIDYKSFSKEKLGQLEKEYFYNIIDNLKNTEIKKSYEKIDVLEVLEPILENFCENIENRNLIINTILENESNFYKPFFTSIYINFVERNWINPFKDENSFSMFEKAVNNIMAQKNSSDYKMGHTQSIVNKLQDNTLILVNKIAPYIEFKKYCLCQYLEVNQSLNLNNNEMKKIHNQYKEEDFTSYYKDFKEIKTYYEDVEEEIVFKELKVNYYKYILPKIIEKSGLFSNNPSNIKRINEAIKDGLITIDSKLHNYPEINDFYRKIGTQKIEATIIYSELNDNMKLFFKNYEMFMNSIISSVLETKNLSKDNKEEEWNNINLFNKINMVSKEKNMTKQKNKI